MEDRDQIEMETVMPILRALALGVAAWLVVVARIDWLASRGMLDASPAGRSGTVWCSAVIGGGAAVVRTGALSSSS